MSTSDQKAAVAVYATVRHYDKDFTRGRTQAYPCGSAGCMLELHEGVCCGGPCQYHENHLKGINDVCNRS